MQLAEVISQTQGTNAAVDRRLRELELKVKDGNREKNTNSS